MRTMICGCARIFSMNRARSVSDGQIIMRGMDIQQIVQDRNRVPADHERHALAGGDRMVRCNDTQRRQHNLTERRRREEWRRGRGFEHDAREPHAMNLPDVRRLMPCEMHKHLAHQRRLSDHPIQQFFESHEVACNGERSAQRHTHLCLRKPLLQPARCTQNDGPAPL